jgi:hypothetical protein
MMINNEMEKCGRKLLWPNLKHYPSIYLDGQRNATKALVRISGGLTEIRTGDLLNTSPKQFHLNHLAQ